MAMDHDDTVARHAEDRFQQDAVVPIERGGIDAMDTGHGRPHPDQESGQKRHQSLVGCGQTDQEEGEVVDQEFCGDPDDVESGHRVPVEFPDRELFDKDGIQDDGRHAQRRPLRPRQEIEGLITGGADNHEVP